jgi:hypothetical protein
LPDIEDTVDILRQDLVDPVAAQVELLQIGAVPQAGQLSQLIVPQVDQLCTTALMLSLY